MSTFTIENLEVIRNDLLSGRIKLDKVVVSDDETEGLRAIIWKDRISFRVTYQIGDSRPAMYIGDAPKTSVENARKIADYILESAVLGTDPMAQAQEAMLQRIRDEAGCND